MTAFLNQYSSLNSDMGSQQDNFMCVKGKAMKLFTYERAKTKDNLLTVESKFKLYTDDLEGTLSDIIIEDKLLKSTHKIWGYRPIINASVRNIDTKHNSTNAKDIKTTKKMKHTREVRSIMVKEFRCTLPRKKEYSQQEVLDQMRQYFTSCNEYYSKSEFSTLLPYLTNIYEKLFNKHTQSLREMISKSELSEVVQMKPRNPFKQNQEKTIILIRKECLVTMTHLQSTKE